jgi:LysM repeat protein
MKIAMLLRRKKLRTATARRGAGTAAEMDYAEMPEPNMKLSRALLIVLLLHVVAVSGIIAFNAIKTRQSSFVPAPAANTENNPVVTPGSTINPNPSNPRSALAQKESAPRDEPKTSHSPAKPLAKDDHVKPAEHRKAPVASGKHYTVLKGDNPVTIAKKLKVSYDDLIALNHIEDPRKLKIGQKLLIPKSTKTKKSPE